jgi:hypothetical protein
MPLALIAPAASCITFSSRVGFVAISVIHLVRYIVTAQVLFYGLR